MWNRCLLLALFSFALLTGCAAKVTKSADFDGGTPRTIALLPINIPAGVAPDKVGLIRRALLGELRNSGFTVLDDTLVQRICDSPECPRAGDLASQYLVDGFFSLELNSVSRSNFLAGYYNAIRGSLTLSDKERKPLLKVEKTESERGGLLFNSGQLLQGVLSQIKNSDDRSFERLADAFAASLVSQVPTPGRTAQPSEAAAIAIQKVEIVKNKIGADQICASATPQSMAFVLLTGRKTNLREISPGRYCARLRLEDFPAAASTLTVELRSAFGSSVRQSVLSTAGQCDLRGLVRLEASAGGKRLVLACTKTRSTPNPLGSGCENHVQSCLDHHFLIYQAQSPLGPFKRIAEVHDVAWKIPATATSDVYQVVAVDTHGGFSVPASTEEVSQGASQ